MEFWPLQSTSNVFNFGVQLLEMYQFNISELSNSNKKFLPIHRFVPIWSGCLMSELLQIARRILLSLFKLDIFANGDMVSIAQHRQKGITNILMQ